MADPVFVDCPEGAWTKVAENVVTGQVWRAIKAPVYVQTYRDTGGAVPTDREEGVVMFVDGEPDVEAISASAAIDVYVYAIGGDGRVRVDL